VSPPRSSEPSRCWRSGPIGADCPWRYDTSEIGGTVSISRLLRDRGCRTDHPECEEHATLATLGGEDLIRPVVAERDALRLGHCALVRRVGWAA
jgi:hypothetical protein